MDDVNTEKTGQTKEVLFEEKNPEEGPARKKKLTQDDLTQRAETMPYLDEIENLITKTDNEICDLISYLGGRGASIMELEHSLTLLTDFREGAHRALETVKTYRGLLDEFFWVEWPEEDEE